jgi:methionyl aminopeptidase
MINVRSKREIDLLKEAGRVVALVMECLGQEIRPGVTTDHLEQAAKEVIKRQGGIATFLGYQHYPYATCISVNEVLIHGFPSKKQVLKEGDIVSIDVGVTKNGYIGDMARTFKVGIVDEVAAKLVDAARECHDAALRLIKPGVHLGDIEAIIEATANQHGFSVTHDYGGHGVGTKLHEDPFIKMYGTKMTGPVLKAGMVLAIEPMLLEKSNATKTLSDGWTVVSVDQGRCAHYENTIVVTDDGYEILTKK